MGRKKKLIDKQAKKRTEKCYFCEESDYSILDVHRIIPGEENGKYTPHNSVVACASCHRRIHAGQIVIDRKYLSTSGKWIIHYWKDGEEMWN